MPCSTLTGANNLEESATLILTMKIQASDFCVTLILTFVIKKSHKEHDNNQNNLGSKDLKSYNRKMCTFNSNMEMEIQELTV
jgi:ABC-type transporter lipoprotein component MlaA